MWDPGCVQSSAASTKWYHLVYSNTRIYHECEGRIENSRICPEDRRLASWGLPSDDKRWYRGTDFSILTSHKQWILFLAHHCFLLKNKLPEVSEYAKIAYSFAWWRHFNITWVSHRISFLEFCVSFQIRADLVLELYFSIADILTTSISCATCISRIKLVLRADGIIELFRYCKGGTPWMRN